MEYNWSGLADLWAREIRPYGPIRLTYTATKGCT